MKEIWKKYNITIIFGVLGLIYTIYCFINDKFSAIVPASILVVFLVVNIVYIKRVQHKLQKKADDFSLLLEKTNGSAFNRLQISCCIIEDDGKIVWYNSVFEDLLGVTNNLPIQTIQEFLNKDDVLDSLKNGKGYKLKFNSRFFSINSCAFETDGETAYLLYFFDETELKQTQKLYNDTRPVVLLTLIDNSDDIYEKFKESECAAIFSEIEQCIDSWASDYGALCRKYSNSRMLIIAEEKSLQKMVSSKFEILDKIRELKHDDISVDVTLSIGVGKDGSLHEIREYARQALDMSQSRGGDQVTIKDETQYKFYGGVSEGKEQKNKVKTRFIAKTVSEIIKGSSNVLIMGHRYSDFDAFGSAAGLYTLVKNFDIEANIVVDLNTTLATPMINQFVEKFGKESVISVDKALSIVNENTLLIVTDTHKKDFAESPELVDRCRKVMVIDHHRKSVGFINDTVLFYHRPNSSSASEMVSEILQYSNLKTKIDPITAQALFAGIMLDTRNFVIRCGVRTFEAAAYLKSCSANTVAAKKLFSSDMDLFRNRNAVIDNAEKYRDICAVSLCDFEDKNIRLITSQAADEMLNIENVKSSFVLFKNGNDVHISARSFGEMNVQLIMEALGGGGHQAMSACQLKDIDLESAKKTLYEAIDSYLDKT